MKILVVFYDGQMWMYDRDMLCEFEYDPSVKLIKDLSTGRKVYDGEVARCAGC